MMAPLHIVLTTARSEFPRDEKKRPGRQIKASGGRLVALSDAYAIANIVNQNAIQLYKHSLTSSLGSSRIRGLRNYHQR